MTFYKYFEKYEFKKMVHLPFNNMGKMHYLLLFRKMKKILKLSSYSQIMKDSFTMCYYKSYLFVMKKIYFQIVTSINLMYMNVKFKNYYQILNLYTTFFTIMQHEIYLKMKNKHNYSIKC